MPTQQISNKLAGKARRLPEGPRGGVELLLVHAVESLGKQGEVVEVKSGSPACGRSSASWSPRA
jgi:large subunit ribosomal protein L9